MNTLTVTGFNTVLASGPALGIATLSGPRELTQEDIEMVSGGLPFVIAPIVVKGAELAAAAFIGGFFGHMGYMAANKVWGEEEQACR
jgi:hypothetical protein